MDDFHCSFCGKRRREVKKLVSGPRVFICNGCVTICRNTLGPRPPAREAVPDLRETTTERSTQTTMPVSDLVEEVIEHDVIVRKDPLPADAPPCSFCGRGKDEVGRLVPGPTVYICNECVELCEDIIEEERTEGSGAST